jgi:hypothetical protein
MELSVRPARPDDACVALLYESAQPYYDAYAGSPARAQRLLRHVFPQRGHAASYELCRVALADGAVAGVLSMEVLSHALSQKAEHIPTASELAAHELAAEEAAS